MSELIMTARAFAHERHDGQTRKDAAKSPYITHPEEVATRVAQLGGDETAIAAAWLHDTIEDCPPTSPAEIAARFGDAVAAVVVEVSDDKSLAKDERKRLQILHAPGKTPRATLVKIADKTANVRAIGTSPPASWSLARKRAYLDWAEAVVAALPPCHPEARAAFTEILALSREALG